MKSIRAFAVLVLALAASPAFAQDGTVTIEGVAHAVPAPPGYCSQGEAIDRYVRMQRGIGGPVPDVLFARCGASDPGFDLYAVLVQGESPPMTRAQYLEMLRISLPGAQAQAQASLVPEEQQRQLSARLSEQMDQQVTVDASGLRPIGVDDMCGYVAGVVEFQGASGTIQVTAVGCATVIGSRISYVFRYFPGTAREQALAAMPEVKAMAQAIQPRT